MCKSTCETLYADPTLVFCVSTCPKGYFADNATASCVLVCTDLNTYG
jgi:hypothetical protein